MTKDFRGAGRRLFAKRLAASSAALLHAFSQPCTVSIKTVATAPAEKLHRVCCVSSLRAEWCCLQSCGSVAMGRRCKVKLCLSHALHCNVAKFKTSNCSGQRNLSAATARPKDSVAGQGRRVGCHQRCALSRSHGRRNSSLEWK